MNEYRRTQKMLKSVSSAYLIAAAAILIFLLLAGGAIESDVSVGDLSAYSSFILIGVVSISFITVNVLRHGISLFVIHWFFVLMFFCIAPLKQYTVKSYQYPVNFDTILVGNLYILVWCMVYGFFWQYVANRGQMPRRLSRFLSMRRECLGAVRIKIYVLSLISAAVAIYFITLAGPVPFLARATYSLFIERLGGWHPFGLLVTFYVRPILFCALIVFWWVLYKRMMKPTLMTYFWFFVLIVVNLIINNPLNSPKFYAFMMLFGVFVLFLSRQHKPSPSFIYIGVLFAGTFLAKTFDTLFRRLKPLRSQSGSLFDISQFDAHENFMHTIEYVHEAGLAFGEQLLGALLFWVPRVFWMNKPIGSGSLIATEYLSRFSVKNFNIAIPLIAEMYLNFHIFGIVFGAVLSGLLTSWIDRKWFSLFPSDSYQLHQAGSEAKWDFFCLLYPFLLGLYLFHLRGDFMSSFAYMCGFVLAFVTVINIMKLRLKL